MNLGAFVPEIILSAKLKNSASCHGFFVVVNYHFLIYFISPRVRSHFILPTFVCFPALFAPHLRSIS